MLTTSTRSRMSRPASSSSLLRRSAARFLLNVVNSTSLPSPGGSRSTRCLTRCSATIVLPVPGPPLTRAGPLYERSTILRWSGCRKTCQRAKSPARTACSAASSVVTRVAGRASAVS